MLAKKIAQSELLVRWFDGDATARAVLVEENLDWLQDLVGRRMGARLRSRVEVGDVVQQSLLVFLNYRPKYPVLARRQLRGILRRMVENVIRDRGSWFARRATASLEGVPAVEDEVADDGRRQPPALPEEFASSRERASWVQAGLERLARSDRDVIVLRTWEQCSFAEIGQRLSLPREVAKKRYQRALPRLAAIIDRLRRTRGSRVPVRRSSLRSTGSGARSDARARGAGRTP